MKVHNIRAERSQQFGHRRHERPCLRVAEHESIERAHPEQHLVGAAPDRLEACLRPSWPMSGLTQPTNIA